MVISNFVWSNAVEYTSANAQFIPEAAGLYAILVKQQAGGYLARYIGKADVLRNRYSQHLASNETNACIKDIVSRYACQFIYVVMGKEQDRVDTESALIAQNRNILQCNKKS